MKISLQNCLALLIAALSVLFLLLLSIERPSSLPAKRGQHWLLLIAHPDDETMFFAPTLLSLASFGVHLHLLSITSGNSHGLGPTRMKELIAAAESYGIPSSQVHFLDPEERQFPDGFQQWDVAKLAAALLGQIHRLPVQPHGVVTFDGNGVSGHPNHEDCFHALKAIGGNLTTPNLLALESVPLWRKYTSFLDLFYVLFVDEFGGKASRSFHALWTDPIRVYHAMSKHRSQMAWFRYLYMAFSRYVYVNTLVMIQ